MSGDPITITLIVDGDYFRLVSNDIGCAEALDMMRDYLAALDADEDEAEWEPVSIN